MSTTNNSDPLLIPVGISSCLLGEKVRYDGGHKEHSYITQTLSNYFEFKPFCPEVSIGLGIPRKPIQLRRDSKNSKQLRCVNVDDASEDFTDALFECGEEQKSWQQNLCGYILKNGSPSCGMERVQVWEDGRSVNEGVGIYAQKLMESFPTLPVEEEGRLDDTKLLENFVQRVFVMFRWRKMTAAGISVDALNDFHTRHELLIMSHDREICCELGQLVAATTRENLEENEKAYSVKLMQTLKHPATRSSHKIVLEQIQGYITNSLDEEDKQELVIAIEKYQRGLIPLIVPITLLNQFFCKYPNEYIAKSWYMQPYPRELKLQNEI